MKIAEDSVKCGEIITSDHKFYSKTTIFPSYFVSAVGILSKNFVMGVGFLKDKFSGPGRGVTGQGDTCIIIPFISSN